MPDPFIRMIDVTKTYADGAAAVRALDSVSLSLAAGEFASITGPSGCGKSTLLNLLGGLDRPDHGEIHIGQLALHTADDRELTQFRRHVAGIVFQFFNLLPSMTLAENVELPLLLRGDRARQARARTAYALDLVGLVERRRHFPHQLSGGEMQRAAIARAIAGEPDILLADEPTGNLDSAGAARVAETLLKIASQKITTLVIVTHSDELARLAPRHIQMLDGKIHPPTAL